MIANPKEKIIIKVEQLKSLSNLDLADLCNITEQAIKAGGGFGWLKTPPRQTLNKYWKGLLLVQNRILLVGRADRAGKKIYNQRIALERALVAREYMIKNGIPERLIEIKSFGEEYFIAKSLYPY